MIRALVPGSSRPGSSPGWGHCVVFLGRTLNSHTVFLSTQEYKWVPANCWEKLTNSGGVTCDGLASTPGKVEVLLAASYYRTWDKVRQLWTSPAAPKPHLSYRHTSDIITHHLLQRCWKYSTVSAAIYSAKDITLHSSFTYFSVVRTNMGKLYSKYDFHLANYI